jgi:hypothetical protein
MSHPGANLLTMTTPQKKPRKPRSDVKGYKLVGVRLRPEQDEALNREAIRRLKDRGGVRPDKSEIVREALDAHPAVGRKR